MERKRERVKADEMGGRIHRGDKRGEEGKEESNGGYYWEKYSSRWNY